jgi:beta-phosphoglucomutase-like phosphatase (HAD superfamily)
MIKAFIFDIDGTLVDSNDFHAKSWERAFAKHGKAIPAQKIRPHIAKGADHLLPIFLDSQEIKCIGKSVAELSDKIFKADYLVQIRPFPMVRELFKKIRDAGARIALETSSKQDRIKDYMVIAQIEDLVEQSASAADVSESKPEPDIFHSAMKQLGNPAHDSVLVVGDTPYDALAAKRAGLRAIGLLCGGHSSENLRENGCTGIYNDPAHMFQELEQILRL